MRSLRLPGIISYRALPGGGTTDFAVEMFYAALQGKPYTCFVRPETRLPMMYMPDATQAILQLMQVEANALTVRTSYNPGFFGPTSRGSIEHCGVIGRVDIVTSTLGKALGGRRVDLPQAVEMWLSCCVSDRDRIFSQIHWLQ